MSALNSRQLELQYTYLDVVDYAVPQLECGPRVKQKLCVFATAKRLIGTVNVIFLGQTSKEINQHASTEREKHFLRAPKVNDIHQYHLFCVVTDVRTEGIYEVLRPSSIRASEVWKSCL